MVGADDSVPDGIQEPHELRQRPLDLGVRRLLEIDQRELFRDERFKL